MKVPNSRDLSWRNDRSRWIGVVVLALAALMPSGAGAQKLNPILYEVSGDTLSPTLLQARRADHIDGTPVIQGSEKIDEIKKVFANQSNKIVAVEIEMTDGVLGQGRVVIAPIQQLRFEKDGAHVRAHPSAPPSPPARHGG